MVTGTHKDLTCSRSKCVYVHVYIDIYRVCLCACVCICVYGTCRIYTLYIVY